RSRCCGVDRQITASTTERSACVGSRSRCACNSEELVAPQTLHTDRQLGRGRLSACCVPSNCYPALAIRHRLKRSVGVQKTMAERIRTVGEQLATRTYARASSHQMATGESSRRTLARYRKGSVDAS